MTKTVIPSVIIEGIIVKTVDPVLLGILESSEWSPDTTFKTTCRLGLSWENVHSSCFKGAVKLLKSGMTWQNKACIV